jgi:hypothetical protein
LNFRASEQLLVLYEEKGHVFMKTVLNFETKSINVIVRRKAYFAFMSWRYEQIWGNYSHLSIVIGI